jgi:tripartite-type tricarboxylate transporter receptor subunit TctC
MLQMRKKAIMSRRRVFIAVCVVLVFHLSERVHSQETGSGYPNRPINLIIPLPPGGNSELSCRLIAKEAEKFLGQPIVPLNKPGAALTIGVAAVAASKPDGYTIGIGAHSPLFLAPLLEKVPYHPINDLKQIMLFTGLNFGIVVRANSPFKSFKDVIAYARQNPKKLTYGTNASGLLYFIMEQIAKKEGVEITLIPYASTFESEAALLGEHIDVVPGDYSQSLLEAGKTRLLVLLKDERSVEDPQVPLLKDLGYSIPCPFFLGILGPKGLPENVVRRLEEAFGKAMKEPAFIKGMRDLRLSIVYRNSQDLTDYVTRNYEMFGKFVKEKGATK